MNDLGRSSIPFLFFTDFKGTRAYVGALQDVDERELLYDFRGLSNASLKPQGRRGRHHGAPHPLGEHATGHPELPNHMNSGDEKNLLHPEPIDYRAYLEQFNHIQKQISRGNTYLANLTIVTPLRDCLPLKDYFFLAKAKYKLFWKDQFCLYSPESFVIIRDNVIETHPMKGTAYARGGEWNVSIQDDPKEVAEHITVADLLRNDLNRVSSGAKVTDYRYTQRIETTDGQLLQMSSRIEGVLTGNWKERIGSILFSLLPAGSISGAPKDSTVRVIEEAEQEERGFFTGVCGIYDGNSLDSGVMIRFMESSPEGRIRYRSGAGITSRSDPHDEYTETIKKIYVPIR